MNTSMLSPGNSLASDIASNPVFAALKDEVQHETTTQAMRYWYTYVLSDTLDGQGSLPFFIAIEQGTDFKCIYLTASAFSYDASHASSFPIPNAAGNTVWAGRGLTMRITDTRNGRELTSGDLPFELFSTPGYGLSFIRPFPFKYFFLRNSKIRFDMRNLDNVNRSAANGSAHTFSIAMHGYKYVS